MFRRTRCRSRRRGAALLAAGCLLAVLQAPAFGAGFLLFEHGSKAMSMGGAFTAQADDGSAIFHNAAGLAFLKERRFDAGVTLISPDSSFVGVEPFPGPGATAEQESAIFTLPHFYYVQPVNQRLTFGFGFNTPFGLATEWANPEQFSGRFISTKAELRGFDFNPSIGWQANPNFGLGFGVVLRVSDVALDRFVPNRDPFTQTVVDVATVDLESDFDYGVGFNFGLLHKVGKYLSWGFMYRSKMEIDYAGDGVFSQVPTGNPVLDAIVAGTLPFDDRLPIRTSIEFPDIASLGIALGLTRTITAEIDLNWVGWSSFDDVVLEFTTAPQFSSVIRENWEDVYSYRLGIRVGNGPRQWRFGYIFDESPQPDESVGPILPDADRNDFTIGYGTARYDVALMYVDFDERTTLTNDDEFFGTYNTDVWLLGVTLKF